MSDEICECGHSINKHYLDNPSEEKPSGYCTHYYESKHVFCNCRKSPGDIAAALRSRVGELERERDNYLNRVQRLESIIRAARAGEYDNAHEINAIRRFLFESIQEYDKAAAALAKEEK